MTELPHPINAEQELLTALIEEVRGLRADLRDGTQPSQPTPGDGPVQLTEPDDGKVPSGVDVQWPEDPASTSLQVDVDAFHVGGGWYEIDGEKIRGRDAAIAKLQE